MPKRETVIWAAVAFLMAATIAGGFWGFSYDDNFITYRYARNWASGEGLVYNPGERVLGTSAPGYALVLGALATFTAPLGMGVPAWGTLLSVFSLAWVGWVLHRALGRRRWVLSLVFVLASLTFPLDVYLLGSEVFPATALVAEAAHQLLGRRRPTLAGLALFGAVFLRLDAGLAGVVLGVAAWLQTRRFPTKFALSSLAPLIVWLGLLAASFGQVIPLTLEGKRALLEVPYTLRQWQMLNLALPRASAVLLLAGALLGGVLAARRGLWSRPMVAALGAWLVAHEIAYRMIGVWFAPWYHIALIQGLLVLFVSGAFLAAEAIAARLPSRQSRVWAATVVAALLLAPVLGPSLSFVGSRWRQPPDDRLRVYQATGRWIDQHLAADTEVLAWEIGVLGWESNRRILDYGGLVSPSFTAAKLEGERARLLAERAPDVIVVVETDDNLGAAVAAPALASRYERLAAFRRPEFRRGSVLVLGRRDPPTR